MFIRLLGKFTSLNPYNSDYNSADQFNLRIYDDVKATDAFDDVSLTKNQVLFVYTIMWV